MSKNNENITVKLNGGLGNQLYIFAAGYSAARRLDVPFCVDISAFSVPGESRSYQLAFLESLVDRIIDDNNKNLIQNAVSKIMPSQIFRERNPIRYDSRIEGVKPGTTLVGYFQSPKYFENVSEEIVTLLKQNIPKSFSLTDSISLHLRRGDYTNASTLSFHGLTSTQYALNGISLIRDTYNEQTVIVFSDEIEKVKSELATAGSKKFQFADQQSLSDLEALLQMSMSQNMVMSNSSFSWWAAYLISLRHPDAIIVAPRPWFSDDSAAADLLLPKWIGLDRR